MSQQSDRLAKRLAAIPANVKRAVIPALVKSGDELVRTMQSFAPVKTGKLKASLVSTPPGQPTPPYSQPGGSRVAGENEVLVTAGDKDVRYAHLVEYGTKKAHAEPFFWPAYRLNKKRIKNRLTRAIRKAVRGEGGAT